MPAAVTDITESFTIFSSLPIPVLVTNHEGLTVWINEPFTLLSGYTLDDLYGKKPGKFLQGAFTDKETAQKISTAIRKQQAIEDEILNYTKDQKPYWVRLQIYPFYNEQNEITHYISFSHDITERREMERQLVMLQAKIAKVKIPQGWVTRCAWKNTLVSSDGSYRMIEEWFAHNSEARISHGISPEAAEEQREIWLNRKMQQNIASGSNAAELP
ncbi:MAG: PAS domain-containing protein [Chloroherpetonaceae bacterium]|nr:PAS domain-containing protein [Chloroherpetonaceae bacterium]